MLPRIILASGLVLRLLILIRGFQSRLIAKYVWFYSYIAAGFSADAVMYVVLRAFPHAYADLYWAFQFATLALGCGVILEIFEHVLSSYPGADRFARLTLFVTFVLIFLFALIYPLASRQAPTATFYVELERDVRTAQIVFFVAILAVVFHYFIPLGRNMRGMMWGYGLYLCASLFTLTFRAYLGHGFDAAWRVLQPLFSCVTLCIWLYALWAYHPNPAAGGRVGPDSDYESLVALTKGRIEALRAHIRRGARIP